MEFVRKKRYVRYHDPKCKTYLRIDFRFRCAYCRTHESELIIGERVFEKDHFKPQAKFANSEDVHRYDNLFYSCKLCNGKSGKSDKWEDDLLNPCNDDIYGEGNHILEQENEIDDFKLLSLTPQGEKYIQIFNLNQLDHRKIRGKRWVLKQKNIAKIEKISNIELNLKMLDYNDQNRAIIDSLKNEIQELKDEILEVETVYSVTSKTDDIIRFEESIRKYVELKAVYYQYDLDYEFLYKNRIVKCDVHIEDDIVFNNGEVQKRICVGQADDWKELDDRICMILFNKSNGKIYYSNVKKILLDSAMNGSRQFFVIKINESEELNDNNVQRFYNEFFN